MELQTYKFGDMELIWLRGADKYTDAGTLFGPVPKAVWSQYYPTTEDGLMADLTDPILIKHQDHCILIDSSLGTEKLDAKQRRNLGVISENKILESLDVLGLTANDIDIILMTHMHNDHAGGLTSLKDGQLVSTFPKATIYMSQIEWDDVRNPNARTRGTYLKENWEPIQEQVVTFDDSLSLHGVIKMYRTGGHSRGHSIITLEQGEETMICMGDLVLTHVHRNPLWVAAVDDYPMDSIKAKEKWLNQAYQNNYKLFFYHDPFYAVLKFDEIGQTVVESVERLRPPIVPFTDSQTKRLIT